MVLFSNNLLIIRGERLNETLRLHPCPKNEEKNRESTIPLCFLTLSGPIL